VTEPILSLEARYYTDPAIFEIEKAHMLAKTWQFAGHISQVENVGDYFTFSIAGENLFCIRAQKDKIRIFYNVCQHRAHELVSVVNLDETAAPMDEWFPGVRDELSEFVPNIEALRPIEFIEIPEKTNWKVSVENYSECYHCSRNHPTFSTGVIKPETYDIQPQGYCLRHTTECQDDLSDMTYPIDLESNPRAGQYSSWFLWPLFSFQVYPGNVRETTRRARPRNNG